MSYNIIASITIIIIIIISKRMATNIVYKFTSKVTGKYYIGSKTECTVSGGRIIGRNGNVYQTSSKDPDLMSEFANDNMELSVLEYVPTKSILVDREAYWQKEYNYKSAQCYNKCLAGCLPYQHINQFSMNMVRNKYGESSKDMLNRNSATTRRDIGAKKLGFSNYGERVWYVLCNLKDTTPRELERKEGWTRKSLNKIVKVTKLADFDVNVDIPKIKSLVMDGASFYRACQICGVTEWAARKAFGETFSELGSISDRLAVDNGFTSRREFREAIFDMYLNGDNTHEIASKIKNTSSTTVARMITEEIRTILTPVKVSQLRAECH